MSTSSQMFNFNSTPGQAGGGSAGQMFNFGTGSANQTGGLGAGLPNITPQTSGALPSPNSGTPPGIVPAQNSPNVGNPLSWSGPSGSGTQGDNKQQGGTGPTTTGTGTGQYQVGTPQDPALTNQFFSWLQSQIGQGMTPFNLSAIDPSTGQPTAPGSLTAPNNQVLQQLMKSFTDPNGIMQQMQQTGMPIDQTPAWKAMVESMQRQIGEGAANLKEGMSAGGNLVGTPYGSAAADYQSQTAKDLNAQLLQATTAAQESARGRQLTATGDATAFGAGMQAIDQSAIDRMLQEFQRTQPQNNPLISNMQQSATTYPPFLHTKDTMDQTTQLMNAITSMAGLAKASPSSGAGGGKSQFGY